MRITTTLVAAAVLAGCSAPSALVPSSPATAQVTPASARCTVLHDAIPYKAFRAGKVVIHAPTDQWAAGANVTNALNEGVYVWQFSNDDARFTRVLVGASESAHMEFTPRGAEVILRATSEPSSGYVDVNVRFCGGA